MSFRYNENDKEELNNRLDDVIQKERNRPFICRLGRASYGLLYLLKVNFFDYYFDKEKYYRFHFVNGIAKRKIQNNS